MEGEVYAIPGFVRSVVGNCWWVRDEVFTELGLRIEEFQQSDTDALFASLYGKNDGQRFLERVDNSKCSSWYNGVVTVGPSSMFHTLNNRYQRIGACFAIDYSDGKPTVVNYLETDYTRQLQEKLLYYTTQGYTVKEDGKQLVSYSNSFLDTVYSYQETSSGNMDGGKVWLIPWGQTHYELRSGTTYATGISKNAEHPVLAMTLLEKLGSDQEFLTKLCRGFEGKDYVLRDGVYEALARKYGSYRMDFLIGPANFVEFDVDFSNLSLPGKEGMTRLETYRESIENAQIWLPVEFNWVYMEEAMEDIYGILDVWLEDHPEYAGMLHN